MLKSVVLLVLVSIAAILLRSQIEIVLSWLIAIHNHLANWLGMVFSRGSIGQYIQAILSLIIIPVIVGGLAALIFWLIKRKSMPHVMTTIWIAWTILLVTMLARL